MSRRPAEPRAGTLAASVLARVRRGPVDLAEEPPRERARVCHTLMRLRSELGHNIVLRGPGRYELRPGVFPRRPRPRAGCRAARVLGRLQVGPVHLHRDAERLRSTPGQIVKSISDLRVHRDLDIRRVALSTYELRPGRYSERGHWGRQPGPLTLAVLRQLRGGGAFDVEKFAAETGRPQERVRCSLTGLRRRHRVESLGGGRFRLIDTEEEETR